LLILISFFKLKFEFEFNWFESYSSFLIEFSWIQILFNVFEFSLI
jgi:hypothetical protein